VGRICLDFSWQEQGRIERAALPVPRLRFPSLPVDGGVYRISITDEGNREVYVGEALDLARRARTYVAPGARYTASWVNAHLLERLLAEATVTLSILVEARLSWGRGDWQSADFAREDHRKLFENAALIEATSVVPPLTVLNRLRRMKEA